MVAALVLAAQALVSDGVIQVGKNVQVSTANARLLHVEPVADVDPDDPRHLIVCSELDAAEPDNDFRVVVYVSFDGGRSWSQSLQEAGIHPSCAFGHGVAYFIHMRESRFYRSVDGGRTWTPPLAYDQILDHPYITVDKLSPKYRGTVYVSAFTATTSFDTHGTPSSGIAVYRSTDEGKSLHEPLEAYSSNGRWLPIMGAAAVMADGTYALLFPEQMKSPFKHGEYDPDADGGSARIKVSISRDGGRTLEPAVSVATTKWGDADANLNPDLQYGLAADTGNGPFRNRLYAVWQAKELGRHRIWFSRSEDAGKTWSGPIAMDDARPWPGASRGPNSFMPTVAVSDRGVVGILWFDRRDNPDGLGWYVRFAASLDGGDTFVPSVRVSAAPMWFAGGHRASFTLRFGNTVADAPLPEYTSGFAAGPDGVFQAVWTDNRTGYTQLWTAPITVSGEVLRNGAAELSGLTEALARAPVHIANPFWNWKTGEFACDVYVKNISATPIAGPLKLRLLRFDSTLGIVDEPRIDGRPTQAGAVFDVSADGLAPGRWSKPLHFTARVTVVFGPHDPDIAERLGKIFTLDSKTFARAMP